MSEESTSKPKVCQTCGCENCCCRPNKMRRGKAASNAGPFGFIAFVGWIGAAIYFVSQVDGFWPIILAVLKSFVWPAYIVYHVLGLLNI